jgi:hypothetical protein
MNVGHEAANKGICTSTLDNEEEVTQIFMQGEIDFLSTKEEEDESPHHTYLGQNYTKLCEDKLADLVRDCELDSLRNV